MSFLEFTNKTLSELSTEDYLFVISTRLKELESKFKEYKMNNTCIQIIRNKDDKLI